MALIAALEEDKLKRQLNSYGINEGLF